MMRQCWLNVQHFLILSTIPKVVMAKACATVKSCAHLKSKDLKLGMANSHDMAQRVMGFCSVLCLRSSGLKLRACDPDPKNLTI